MISQFHKTFTSSMIIHKIFILLFGCASIACVAGEADCGPLTNHFGPFDYNSAPLYDRQLVERPHFPPHVEQLRKGNTASLGGDISYTLEVFPNHPRALNSMANLAIRQKRAKPEDSRYSVDCWFDRAIRFRSEDPAVRMIYAVYLSKLKRTEEALEQLNVAVKFDSDNANLNYNLGLVYFDLKDYDKSLKYAHRAYGSGFQLPGLKNKLIRVGKWKDRELLDLDLVNEEPLRKSSSEQNGSE